MYSLYHYHEQENSLHPPLMLGGGRKSKNSNKSQAQIQAEKRAASAKSTRKWRSKKSKEEKKKESVNGTKRMRKSRGNRSAEKKALDNAKDRLRMRKERAIAKQLRVGQSCTFEDTPVSDIPGKDYNHAFFEDNPEVAVQLWYDNNGSWRDREPKWLAGYLHAVDYLEEKKMEDATRNVVEWLDKLHGVIKVGVKHSMTIITLVYMMLSKKDWITLRKWQGDECLEDFEMSALLWIADNIDIKLYEAAGLFENVTDKSKSCTTTIHSTWAESLKGLRLQVLLTLASS